GHGDSQVTVAEAGVQGTEFFSVPGQVSQDIEEQGAQGAGPPGAPYLRVGCRGRLGTRNIGGGLDRLYGRGLSLREERGSGRRIQEFRQLVVEQQQRQGRSRHLQAGGELANVAAVDDHSAFGEDLVCPPVDEVELLERSSP